MEAVISVQPPFRKTQFPNETPPSAAEGPGPQPRATRRPPRNSAGHWAFSQPARKINKSLLFSSPGISADSHSTLNSHGRLRKEEKCADFSLSRDGPKGRAGQSGQGGGNSTKVGKKMRVAVPESRLESSLRQAEHPPTGTRPAHPALWPRPRRRAHLARWRLPCMGKGRAVGGVSRGPASRAGPDTQERLGLALHRESALRPSGRGTHALP